MTSACANDCEKAVPKNSEVEKTYSYYDHSRRCDSKTTTTSRASSYDFNGKENNNSYNICSDFIPGEEYNKRNSESVVSDNITVHGC